MTSWGIKKSWYQVTSTWAIAWNEKHDLIFGGFFLRLPRLDKLWQTIHHVCGGTCVGDGTSGATSCPSTSFLILASQGIAHREEILQQMIKMKNLWSLFFQNWRLLCVGYALTIIVTKTLQCCQFEAAASPEGQLPSAAGESIMSVVAEPLGVKYLIYAKR